MNIEDHKIEAAFRLMEQCRVNDDIHRRILGTGIELCLETLGINLNKKAPGAGKQSGTKENITKVHYRAD